MATTHEESISPGRRSPLAFWWLLGLALAAAVGWRLYVGRIQGGGRDGSTHPAVGRALPWLGLEPLTGQAPSLSHADLQGKVTLVNFWGPWCGPCRIEFPHLYELRQGYRHEPRVQVISVSCSGYEGPEDNSPEDRDATAAFLREQKADMPTYYDPFFKSRAQLVQTARLGEFTYPTTVILDGSGTIRGLWTGYAEGDELMMHRLMETLVREAEKR